MAFSPFVAPDSETTLLSALLDAREKVGGGKLILEDVERNPLTYDRLILASLVLGRKLIAGTTRGERIGILLPNVSGMVVSLLGLTFRARTPVLLNFTAGQRNLLSACETAQISTIITARRFVDQGKLDDLVAALGEGRRIIYLEDVRKEIGLLDKVIGLIQSKVPRFMASRAGLRRDDPGVVLFTSGSEGKPKGVVLSQGNLVANARQIAAHGANILQPDEVIMNPLPMFHSYGLTAGTLLGLLSGMKVVLYPSPLHYRQVPKLIGEVKATLLLGTDTFLVGYARAADPDDLKTVRFVITGAERVKEDTRKLWRPFGTVILEGYGCTECSPVLSCNTPEKDRPGTVGTLLPGINWRLDPVAGITEGGRLTVQGSNVMSGYLLADNPGVLVPPVDGWHDTGDIVSMSDDGFITIKGRAKRFAKIGGEMVSLAAIETMVAELWPGHNHVGVALPDSRKGEQVILVTDKPGAEREPIIAYARGHGMPELWVPRAVLVLETIPVLGSGKIDHAGTAEMVSNMRPLL
jgi:acyl-[acyl-carrier-protein]-phospholipid O-acyltransferase/long-chain-fatty-acid--[acyl-carrier-protein] ligase